MRFDNVKLDGSNVQTWWFTVSDHDNVIKQLHS